MEFKQWENFKCGDWQSEINVRDFIQKITHLMKVILAF